MSQTESMIYEAVARVVDVRLKDGKPKDVSWSYPKPQQRVDLDPEGARVGDVKDRHWGMTRIMRGYQIGLGRKGAVVSNDRQLSFCTAADLIAIAASLGISERIAEKPDDDLVGFMAAALGANFVIEPVGEYDESWLHGHLGPGVLLLQSRTPDLTMVRVTCANLPCHKPAEMLYQWLELDSADDFMGVAQFTDTFIKQAATLRGWLASVYAPGELRVGDELGLQLPIDVRDTTPDWRTDAARKRFGV